MARYSNGACDALGDCVQNLGRALFRIIKLRINFRICYLRRIKLALEKINFVNISYLLFPISFRPPRRLNPWRPSPLSGGVRTAGEVYSEDEGRTPLAILRMALSPFQGACVNSLRNLPTPSPPQSLAALSPFQGACERLGKFILRMKEEPPSPFYEWPSPPRGRAMRYEALLGDSMGVRTAGEVYSEDEGRTPLAS